ncbi:MULTISPECIES: protein YhfH [Cytobacillus]|uniref:YhfH family protein n=1 Tax=Cytobacillus stercorigallinarum TaxID=2762240 RepID=A0ABR8QRS2_9BACI|nr:protein YhfH [Cytobacillus stercorigallinarum]MBD7937987.1 YhfH family protein [Cytobacillus stercorigallinarum]
MVQNILEFFRNLPQKQCAECGKSIEEQHECYGNKCDHCLGVSDM